MLRCMLSPNDSCETPICSDRKRESPPIFAAIIWSMEGPLGPASGELRAGHQPAHGVGVTVALAARRRIIHSAEHMNVLRKGASGEGRA